jgi:prepilin-type N-terminal cleavage/methylation domain-containing protein
MNHQRRATDAHGFTLIELMISMTIMMIIMAGALTTFDSAMGVSDAAGQLADANQNLRAGTNQLIRDVMQAGRIIGPEGIPVPNGAGAGAINRPGPTATPLTFTLTAGSTTLNLPDISTGSGLGTAVNGVATDIVTLLTVDPFMAPIETPPSGAVDPDEGTIDPAGAFVTLPASSLWLIGDTVNQTPAIKEGDLVLFKNALGSAVQTVTRLTATAVYFDPGAGAGDWFNFNQRGAAAGSVTQISSAGWTATTLFRLMMITYYVDNPPAIGPRLMRKINNFPAQALAGVVEDLGFTYDLVDAVTNPTEVPSLPYTSGGVTYTANQIRKVNIRLGVRSERTSSQTGEYLRNHLSTSVGVRSLASVDRYAVDTTP